MVFVSKDTQDSAAYVRVSWPTHGRIWLALGALLFAGLLACAMRAHGANTALAADETAADVAKSYFIGQFEVEDVGYSFNPDYAHDCLSAQCTLTVPDMPDAWDVYEPYLAYTDPVTGEELRPSVLGTTRLGVREATTYLLDCTGLRPDTSYRVACYAVVTVNGVSACTEKVYGNVKTDPLEPPVVKATKLTANKARLSVEIPAKERARGAFQTDVYCGTTRVKTFASNGSATKSFTRSAKGAGTATYRAVVSWVPDTSIAASSVQVKPRANVKKFASSTKAAAYPAGKRLCSPLKLWYTPKGKLKAKCVWVNNLVVVGKAKGSFKMRVTVRCQGKKIAQQVFSSGTLKRMSAKQATLTFKKAKKACDLLNGGATWSAKVVR